MLIQLIDATLFVSIYGFIIIFTSLFVIEMQLAWENQIYPDFEVFEVSQLNTEKLIDKTITNCKLNLECPARRCPNRIQCDDLSIAWEIPYKRTSEGIFVKQYGCRYEWSSEGTYFGSPIGFCPLPNGQYLALDSSYHESEIKDRLIEHWRNAGWEAAVANPNFTRVVEDNEEIEIPF